MEAEAYKKDPCRASSLPYWKIAQTVIPPHLRIIRDDEMTEAVDAGTDDPYFKMIHCLNTVSDAALIDGFVLASADPEELAAHIRECYAAERITADALRAYTHTPVYSADLWIAVRDRATGRIAASGIGALDTRIGEGVLDWIQVSPAHRRKGLGAFIVCELLRRMRGKAAFVTVSGRINNPTGPMALYQACGFTDPVIWHVLSIQSGDEQ
jgi:GNAT superfamily N-acetyltransferase